MKKYIATLFLLSLTCCDTVGFRNVKIMNLASKDLYIEGLERKCRQLDNGKLKCSFDLKNYNVATIPYFGISFYVMGSNDSNIEQQKKFQEFYGIRIYYKSKKCLIFKDDRLKEINWSYINSVRPDKILALTNKGLELLTKEQYEANKDKYTLNDSNVKCLKDVK